MVVHIVMVSFYVACNMHLEKLNVCQTDAAKLSPFT